MAILDVDAIFVTSEAGRRGEAPQIRLRDGGHAGAVVAAAIDRAGSLALTARFLGFLGGRSATEWDLVDADGNRLLEVVKPVQRLRGSSPTVSLVDGTPLGRAVAERLSGRPSVALLAHDERTLGTLVPARGDGRPDPITIYRVQAADGLEVGEIALQVQGAWGYHVGFEPGADVAVRALTLAYTLCLVHQDVSGLQI